MIRLVAFAASASLILMPPVVSARELRPLEAYSVHLVPTTAWSPP